jgi:hypothetical protein
MNVKVLCTESLDVQLDSSMREFLKHSVKFDTISQQLVIPQLLQFYQDYVQLNQEPESHTTVPSFTSMSPCKLNIHSLFILIRGNVSYLVTWNVKEFTVGYLTEIWL